jgi:hypothetical protein
MKLTAKMFAMLIAVSVATNGYTCTEDGTEGIAPENDMFIPANIKGLKTGITEEKFHEVIDKVSAVYAPIISSMGATLNVVRNWEDGTVNAYASRSGNTWNVAMFGGLARHATITEDGFALVVCHEIGHHIGGAPKKGGGWWGGIAWASNEGQSDYFATLKCLRKVFISDDNAAVISSMNIPDTLRASCSTAYASAEDQNICIRGGMAGMSVSKLFQALRNATVEPKFDTPDPRVVTATDHNHPAYQCRLDTYFQGALCEVSENDDVSDTDEKAGTCNLTTGHTSGIRPLCWLKPVAN